MRALNNPTGTQTHAHPRIQNPFNPSQPSVVQSRYLTAWYSNNKKYRDALRAASAHALVLMLCLVFLFALTGSAGYANEADDLAGAGTLYLSNGAGARIKAPRLETRVHMDISGIVARVQVTQRFGNSSDQWVEGLYAFPLPENSAVDQLRMTIGERVIEGEIKEKEQAQQLYAAARDAGQRATLVEQHRPNLFRTNVANIGPKETIEVSIAYLQIVDQQAGRYSVRFPMTITPRYIPDVTLNEVPLNNETPVAAIAPTSAAGNASTTLSDMQPPLAPADTNFNSAHIEIDVDVGVPIEKIASTYHPILVSESGRRYHVRLAQKKIAPDHDFELAWTPVVHGEPAAAVFREHTDDGEHVLITVLPPQDKSKLVLPREVIYIIDTSGSMSGQSIEQARAALNKALGTLTPHDRFNVIQFNSIYEVLFPRTVTADESNLGRARDYVRRLQANGGTEMLPALKAAMSMPATESYLRQIIFITDGAVSNEEQLMRAIHDQLGNARLFTVGIGSAPNSYFMRQSAQIGHGTFTYIGSTSEVDTRISELIKKIEQPALTDIKLHWPAGAKVEMAPQVIADLYAGEPVVVTARLDADTRGTLTLTGASSSPWSRKFALGIGQPRAGVAKLWARNKVTEFTEQHVQGVSDDQIRNQVLPLALHYGLVTKYTSLVAIDRTPARPANESLEAQRVPNAKPEGSEWQTVAYPKTATAAQLKVLIGLAGLFLAFVLMPRRNAFESKR